MGGGVNWVGSTGGGVNWLEPLTERNEVERSRRLLIGLLRLGDEDRLALDAHCAPVACLSLSVYLGLLSVAQLSPFFSNYKAHWPGYSKPLDGVDRQR